MVNQSDSIRQDEACKTDSAADGHACWHAVAFGDRVGSPGVGADLIPAKADKANDAEVANWATQRVNSILSESNGHWWQGRYRTDLEKDLRHTTSVLNSNQIPAAMRDSIAGDRSLSAVTKEIIGVYLGASNGDSRSAGPHSGGTDMRTERQYSELIDIALKYRDLDVFAEVMSNPAARAAWQKLGDVGRLKTAFSGSDYAKAVDYIRFGKVGTAAQVFNSTGLTRLTTDTESLQLALRDMSAKERSDFAIGEHLLNATAEISAQDEARLSNMSTEERDDAKSYYTRLHNALDGASTSKAQLETYSAMARGEFPQSTSDADPPAPTYPTALAQYDQIRDSEYKLRHGVASSVANSFFGSPSRYQADDAVNNYTSRFAQFSSRGQAVSLADMSTVASIAEATTDNALATNRAAADYISDGIVIGAAAGSIALTAGIDMPVAGGAIGRVLIKYGARAAIATSASVIAKVPTKLALLGEDYGGLQETKRDSIDAAISGSSFILGGDLIAAGLKVGARLADALVESALRRLPVNDAGSQILKRETYRAVNDAVTTGAHDIDLPTFRDLADNALGDNLVGNKRLVAIDHVVGTIKNGFYQPKAVFGMLAVGGAIRTSAGALGGAVAEGGRQAMNWDTRKSAQANMLDILTGTGRGATVGAVSALVIAPVFSAVGRRIESGVPFLRRPEVRFTYGHNHWEPPTIDLTATEIRPAMVRIRGI